jgi:23S rRNA pseudouridine1911/1915/1917 synthase
VDAPIDRHPTHDYRWAVVRGGKPSITHYEVIEAFPGASLVRVELETGRTHQIRVHFSALHHPCVGDLTYGADPTFAARLGLERQWLHAVELSFAHPRSGERVTFRSADTAAHQQALEKLRA